MLKILHRLLASIIGGRSCIRIRRIHGYGLWIVVTLFGNITGNQVSMMLHIVEYLHNIGIWVRLECRIVRIPATIDLVMHQLYGSLRRSSRRYLSKYIRPNYYNNYFNHYRNIGLYLPIHGVRVGIGGKAYKWGSQYVHYGYNTHTLHAHPNTAILHSSKRSIVPVLAHSYTVHRLGTIGLRSTFK